MESLSETDEAKTRFDALLETAVEGIIVIDVEGHIQVFNPACVRLFGYIPDEVLGKNVKMLMPSPYQEEHDQYIANYRSTGRKKIIGIGREVVGRRKDGSTFPMYLSVGEGRFEGESIFVGVINDLTERERAERRLKELQTELIHVSRLNEMGQMASALAHELNQPLTATTNYVRAASRTLNQIKADDPAIEKAKEMMAKAAEQTLRAGQIVRRLREFIAKGETQRTAEDLNEVIIEAMALALVGSGEKGINVHRGLQAGLPFVLIDKIQIQQVVLNLIRNSIEALQEVETRHLYVATQLEEDGRAVAISVSDTGPGLAPEIADHIFQPFSTTKQDGMGIGLSICRSIIDSHGGQLIWEPPKTGTGACFRFTLPITDAQDDLGHDA